MSDLTTAPAGERVTFEQGIGGIPEPRERESLVGRAFFQVVEGSRQDDVLIGVLASDPRAG